MRFLRSDWYAFYFWHQPGDRLKRILKSAVNSRKTAITKEEKRLVSAKSRLCKSRFMFYSQPFNSDEMVSFSPRPEGASWVAQQAPSWTEEGGAAKEIAASKQETNSTCERIYGIPILWLSEDILFISDFRMWCILSSPSKANVPSLDFSTSKSGPTEQHCRIFVNVRMTSTKMPSWNTMRVELFQDS